MGARNRDELTSSSDFTQRFGAANDGDPQLARAYNLRVLPGHRRRDDHGADTIRMRRVVRVYRDPESPEIIRCFGVCVASGDVNPTPNEQLGQSAHPRASDADEVDGTRVGRVEKRHGVSGAI
jgi:hypothetical protein